MPRGQDKYVYYKIVDEILQAKMHSKLKHVEASAPRCTDGASCEARMTRPSYEDQTQIL